MPKDHHHLKILHDMILWWAVAWNLRNFPRPWQDYCLWSNSLCPWQKWIFRSRNEQLYLQILQLSHLCSSEVCYRSIAWSSTGGLVGHCTTRHHPMASTKGECYTPWYTWRQRKSRGQVNKWRLCNSMVKNWSTTMHVTELSSSNQ